MNPQPMTLIREHDLDTPHHSKIPATLPALPLLLIVSYPQWPTPGGLTRARDRSSPPDRAC